MGCFCSKHDNQSEDPINEPRPQLTEPRYDNAGQTGGGSHSPPTPAPNEPAPHEIGIAVTTPDNAAAQQQEPHGTYYSQGSSSAPQAPATLPESAAEGENRQGDVRERSSSSSSSSSSSNRETRRAEEGNR